MENNSQEMTTIVETYIIPETSELIYDSERLNRWNDLINELGLVGQTTIVNKDKSPIPFLNMKTSLIEVFKTLCPQSRDVKEYNYTPIPVEILELVSLSIKEGYFDQIQIWYDGKNPDLACIGLKAETYIPRTKKGWEWGNVKTTYKEALELCDDGQTPYLNNMIHYLIGRWGDVKRSFSELKEMAKSRFISEQKTQLLLEIKQHQRKLDDLELEAAQKFSI